MRWSSKRHPRQASRSRRFCLRLPYTRYFTIVHIHHTTRLSLRPPPCPETRKSRKSPTPTRKKSPPLTPFPPTPKNPSSPAPVSPHQELCDSLPRNLSAKSQNTTNVCIPCTSTRRGREQRVARLGQSLRLRTRWRARLWMRCRCWDCMWD